MNGTTTPNLPSPALRWVQEPGDPQLQRLFPDLDLPVGANAPAHAARVIAVLVNDARIALRSLGIRGQEAAEEVAAQFLVRMADGLIDCTHEFGVGFRRAVIKNIAREYRRQLARSEASVDRPVIDGACSPLEAAELSETVELWAAQSPELASVLRSALERVIAPGDPDRWGS